MLIGICGKKQVGKNTAGNILSLIDCFEQIREFGLPPKTINEYIKNNLNDDYVLSLSRFDLTSFAEKLKGMASILCDTEYDKYENEEFKESIDELTNMSNRQVLQRIGETMRNIFGEDIWIKSLFNKFDSKFEKGGHIIITDVRYKNEADYIKNKGGILIRINRNTRYNDNHISEIDLDDYEKFDYIVDNNGTINQLIDKIVDIYNDLLKK